MVGVSLCRFAALAEHDKFSIPLSDDCFDFRKSAHSALLLDLKRSFMSAMIESLSSSRSNSRSSFAIFSIASWRDLERARTSSSRVDCSSAPGMHSSRREVIRSL